MPTDKCIRAHRDIHDHTSIHPSRKILTALILAVRDVHGPQKFFSRLPIDIFEPGSLHAARDQVPRQPHEVFAHPTPAQTRTLVRGPKSQVQQCMVLVSYIKELVVVPIVKRITSLTILQSILNELLGSLSWKIIFATMQVQYLL